MGNAASKTSSRLTGRLGVRAATAAIVVCLPLAAACGGGFGSPTLHDVANLQATAASIGNIQVRDAFVVLPKGSSADKGGTAYVELVALNSSDQQDELVQVTATTHGTSSAGPVATSTAPVGDETVPAKTPSAPGEARLYFALTGLTTPLHVGDSLVVSLQFKNAGAAQNLVMNVRGTDVVASSFLPSGSASLPISGSPAISSVPASSASAPSSPAASRSASGSTTPSPTSTP